MADAAHEDLEPANEDPEPANETLHVGIISGTEAASKATKGQQRVEAVSTDIKH